VILAGDTVSSGLGAARPLEPPAFAATYGIIHRGNNHTNGYFDQRG
jgi:hypothetical protein